VAAATIPKGKARGDRGLRDGNGGNASRVIPVSTSASQGKRGLTVVEIPGGSAGLPKTSLAVCHQVTTLDRAKLAKRIGTLPPEFLGIVEEGLRATLDLD
jgi:mRNA-degrading endonuclease toxin of MazEF toxin-antitoxin module